MSTHLRRPFMYGCGYLPDRLALSALIAAVLAGCGGGGGGADVATVSPAPAPATAPAADAVPAAAGISLTNYGGICDGRTDNNAAISLGLADTTARGLPLLIPAGQCNFSQVIHLDSGKIVGSGSDSVLYATDWQQASIFMSGNAPRVSNVTLTGTAAPRRQSNWEATKIATFDASGFVIDGVTIEAAPAASIQTGPGSSRGLIANNTIRNSLADSIHMSDGASDITVERNVIENSGDDGIAVVSYLDNPVAVNNITARNNAIRNNKSGRGMSVVGGRTVLYENNDIEGDQQSACLYIAQESSFATWNVVGVTAQRNTLRNCGSLNTGNAAVMIGSDGEPNDDIQLVSNDIVQDSRNGIRYFGPQTRLLLENNRYSGSGAAYDGISSPDVTIVPYISGSVGYVAN